MRSSSGIKLLLLQKEPPRRRRPREIGGRPMRAEMKAEITKVETVLPQVLPNINPGQDTRANLTTQVQVQYKQ